MPDKKSTLDFLDELMEKPEVSSRDIARAFRGFLLDHFIPHVQSEDRQDQKIDRLHRAIFGVCGDDESEQRALAETVKRWNTQMTMLTKIVPIMWTVLAALFGVIGWMLAHVLKVGP